MPKEKSFEAPEFLVDLLTARSPSGYENEAQAVFDRHVQPAADEYRRDALGNRIAVRNPGGDPVLMLAGHMDELGLIIKHVSDKGFLYFDTIGNRHDRATIGGRRVNILTRNGIVKGVTGKPAIHLMSRDEQNNVPQIQEMWIDIGAADKKDALKRVSIGDVATFDQGFELIHGSIGVARAFDNKAGAYIVGETLRRLAKTGPLAASVVAAATTQEEIGCRGAIVSGYSVKPHLAVAVDAGHATDHPGTDPRKHGDSRLGGGPILCRGATINPFVVERLAHCAEKKRIPYQLEAEPRATGTDADNLQIARAGVATGLISVPVRYMHTPSEVVDLQDIENCVRLLTAFAQSLKKGEHGIW